MICRLRVIVALAALLIGASFAPTGAQAHFAHDHTTAVAKQHTTAVVKQKAPSLGLKSASADQRGRAAFAKMPLKSAPAPVSCDGLCCLGFGLSCCSAAVAPHLGVIHTSRVASSRFLSTTCIASRIDQPVRARQTSQILHLTAAAAFAASSQEVFAAR